MMNSSWEFQNCLFHILVLFFIKKIQLLSMKMSIMSSKMIKTTMKKLTASETMFIFNSRVYENLGLELSFRMNFLFREKILIMHQVMTRKLAPSKNSFRQNAKSRKLCHYTNTLALFLSSFSKNNFRKTRSFVN